MADPRCHYCDRLAEEECPACGRLFCAEHGEDVCLRCLAPESATPSAAVYRGSLLALAVATLVTIFLIVRPPASKGSEGTVRTVATATPAFAATATPTRAGQATPRPSATASAPATTTRASATASATTPAGQRSYTVQAGDTLDAIARRFGTTVEAILALNPGVTAETLPIGAVLVIPPAP